METNHEIISVLPQFDFLLCLGNTRLFVDCNFQNISHNVGKHFEESSFLPQKKITFTFREILKENLMRKEIGVTREMPYETSPCRNIEYRNL